MKNVWIKGNESKHSILGEQKKKKTIQNIKI